MNIFVLYHFDGSKNSLTYDVTLRLRAAILYAEKNYVSNVFFVGGNFREHVSGADQMREYYKKNPPSILLCMYLNHQRQSQILLK